MDGFIKAIIDKLKERLERDLTETESKIFSQKRSFIAYEMILDYISDDRKSKKEIENYVIKVIEEQ